MPAYKTPKQFPGVSKLPRPIQGLVQSLFPADQLPTPATTIGPKAIPLPDEYGYLNRVLKHTLGDIVTEPRTGKELVDKTHLFQTLQEQVPEFTAPHNL